MPEQRFLIRGKTNGLGTLIEMPNILRLQENKIKITLKFLLSPIRMVKKIKHPCWWWYGSRGAFIHAPDCANVYNQTLNKCVVVPLEDVTLSTKESDTIIGHIPKWYFLLSQRHLLNHIHSCSIHNIQKLKTT